ncbi:MAG: metallophosphoesterase, partial [Bdellovibrionales bacterium]|nr:metallophosphoesterase [Bdellovibrionales bacterium]
MRKLIYTFALLFPLLSSAKNIVALGDLHGDLHATVEVLKKASIIDENQNWIGKDTILVQTGDQIDRGAYDKEIIDLFEKLAQQASLEGGEVHSLIGNHEAMNVYGNFKYV